jgi:glycosyltransferase involved in cell wall biosynthesis
MSASLPVVATRVGGVPEVVEENRTGLLAPSGDDDTLARFVIEVGTSPDLAGPMGRLGRLRAESLFDEEMMFANYERIYRELSRSARVVSADTEAVSSA